jgi:purine-binding chemotaxis protein CheW
MDLLSDIGTNAYLIFEIENDLFAAEVEKVVRIAEIPAITSIPKSPPFLKGVINQRGSVIPMIDTKYKFAVKQEESSEDYQVIVIFRISYNDEEVEIAAPVTAVKDVISAEDITVNDAPEMGLNYKPEYIKGMIVNKEEYIILLDIDKVLTSEEIIKLLQSVNE